MRRSLLTHITLTICFALISIVHANAQDEDEFISVIKTDSPLTIDLEKEDVEVDDVKLKKKKRKPKVYYGIKTKKGFSKTGFGNNVVFETFNYLKKHQEPDQYVRDIYWYDFKKRQIRRTPASRVDPDYGVLLHGPYKKFIGDKVLEEGIFFKGSKHGRWNKFSKKDILLDKEKYYKGWAKQSIAKYYDDERKQLKEIIPIEYEKKEGNYYYFFENGLVAVKGEYQSGVKVGLWREYYEDKRRRIKREIQFAKNPYDQNFKQYINKEWDKKGKIIYDRKAALAKIN